MSRARLLKPGFFTNEDLLELPFEARLLFAGLWTLADKEGRLEDRPKRIKIELFPGDNVDVDVMLEALASKGFVQRYEVDGRRLLQVLSFHKHQHPHHREPESTLPPPRGWLASPRPDLGEPEASPPEAVSGSSNGSIAEAETVAEAERDDASPPAFPFAFLYAKRYRERNQRAIPPADHGIALSLEKEFGSHACIAMADAKGWDKHPNYLRPGLEESKSTLAASTNGTTPVKSRRFSG